MPLHNYSSGIMARLAFSVATVMKLEALIVDEALAVGDSNFQKKSMIELISGGTTVLYVSSNLEQIKKICNRVVWSDLGRTVEEEVSATVWAHYCNPQCSVS